MRPPIARCARERPSRRAERALGLGSLPKGRDDCLSILPNRQPHFPPESPLVLGRKLFIRVRPESLKSCGPDPSNRIDKPSVVAGVTGAIPLLLHVITDETLEVIELPVGHEHRCVSLIAHTPNIQQLNSRPLPRQTLERQFDAWKALELDPKPQTLVHPRGLLRFASDAGLPPHHSKLLLQCATVAGTNTFGNNSGFLRGRRRRPVSLRPRKPFDDEVSTPSVRAVRHAAPCGYTPLTASLSAMARRSFSITRMSGSRTRGRS